MLLHNRDDKISLIRCSAPNNHAQITLNPMPQDKSTKFPLGAATTLAQLEGDVHPVLHRLRADEPISWLPAINGWLITRRDLAIEVMRDAKTFTVDHPNFSTGQVVGPSMLSLDGESHLRHRSPFERPFRLREVQTRFRSHVFYHIQGLIDGFIARGQAELRGDFAGPVAVKTMVTALGLTETPVEIVLDWYNTIVDSVTRVSVGEPVSAAGREAYNSLCESLRPSLIGREERSLLAAASGSNHKLEEKQILSNAAVLLFGGIETTEGMISNIFSHLFTHPTVQAKVAAETTLVAAAVEESLRLEPAAAVVDRYATSNVQLGDAMIKKGDLVQVSLAGANRDPEIFPEPDRFDLTRDNLSSHVTFAQGPHVCLGIHLARLEAQFAIEQALIRLTNLRLDDRQDGVTTMATPQGLIFRKPLALHVRWG